jgi:hypothetical protein
VTRWAAACDARTAAVDRCLRIAKRRYQRAIADASYKKRQRNRGVTEFVEIPNRGHVLTIDNEWREVAGTDLSFVNRLV